LKVTAGLSRRPVALTLQNPVLVITILELDEGRPQFVEIAEAAHPQKRFFESTKEALNTPISFRLTDESGRWLDAEKCDFSLEIIAHVHAAMVMAQLQTVSDAGSKSPEAFPNTLADRFESFEAGGLLHRMDAHAFRCAVIDCGEVTAPSASVKVAVASVPHI
jgi:hypothetical protein